MVKIRRGNKKDARNYLRIQLEAFPMEDAERHKKYFKQKIERKEIFVLESDGKYIGHLTYSKFISPPFTNSVYIEEFVIQKEFMKKGYGKLMLSWLVKEAERINFDRILLDTWNDPKNKGIKFYKKHGFKQVGKIKTKTGNELIFELLIENWK
jgi:GNAT superfamily N-acetyltransferase